MIDIVVRHIPGQHWIRLVATFQRSFEPGHEWLYHGIVRRDAWRIGPIGLGFMRLPKDREAMQRRVEQSLKQRRSAERAS